MAKPGVVAYYGYRWYGTLDGRWKSRDPIGEDGGVNLYSFVGNDGVNLVDGLGEEAFAHKESQKLWHTTKLWRKTRPVAEVVIELEGNCDFDDGGACAINKTSFQVKANSNLLEFGKEINLNTVFEGQAWSSPDSRKCVNATVIALSTYDATKENMLSAFTQSLLLGGLRGIPSAAGALILEHHAGGNNTAAWIYTAEICCECSWATEFACKSRFRVIKDSLIESKSLFWDRGIPSVR